MTSAELRLWAQVALDHDGIDRAAANLLFKLTDQTPITPEFAGRVSRLSEADLEYSHDDSYLGINNFTNSKVTTVGQVNTLLWQAGLLEQMEGE